MKKIQGYILYVDILGYKNLLAHNNEQENERLKNLLGQFTKIYSSLNFSLGYGQGFDKEKLFKRFFSDNFLFVYESSIDNYLDLLTMQGVASQIQYQFLCCGILTRGSITYGEIEYTDEIVFGCDLIKAVELESHPEPSILIDENLKDIYVSNGLEYNTHNSLFFVQEDSELDRQDVVKGLERYLFELNKTIPDKKTIEKISWVVDKMNEYFIKTGNKCRLQFDSSVKLVNEHMEEI